MPVISENDLTLKIFFVPHLPNKNFIKKYFYIYIYLKKIIWECSRIFVDTDRKSEFSTCVMKDMYEKSKRKHDDEINGANLPVLTYFQR